MEKKVLRPSPTAILNLRLDINFKAIFTQGTKGSDLALQSFLSSVIGRKIKRLKLTENEPAASSPSQMQMSFDVSVTFDDGEKAAIEVQGRDREYDFAVRSEIQAARLLNNNAKKGGQWKAGKVYQISVLNFHYKKGDKSELSWYSMRDKSGNELSDKLNVIYIDLLSIKKLVGTPVESLSPLQKWGLFLSYADDERETDYIKKIAKSEEGIMEANRIAKKMSDDDAYWFRQNSIDTYWRDYYSELEAVKKKGLKRGMQEGFQQGRIEGIQQGRVEGIQQGRVEGIQQGRVEGIQQGRAEGAMQKAEETAAKMLKMGMGAESQISQITGLSLERVKKLKEQLAKA